MTDKEKLVELIRNAKSAMVAENLNCDVARNYFIAEFLIENGVTVQDRLDEKQATSDLASDKTSEWISVKDRLPEEPLQTVLVTNGKETCVAVYSVVYDEFGVMCGKENGTFGVKYWMPLPEPPKGE